ncbi:MAG: hypothetical protein HG457_006795 [Flavobacteriaceae bacterium]|nr:hypothetical protein [Flavobacteriaceae bacterium]
MDELELLKKDWKENKSDDFKNYTEKELFAMTKKRSVSIAKWVFIIALLELGFWFLIGYLMPSSSSEDKYQDIPFVDGIFSVMDMITILLPFVFIGSLLYLNFKIRIEENPKKLMGKILLMKKCIQWYIRIFLGEVVVFFIISMILTFYIEYNTLKATELEELYFMIFIMFIPFLMIIFIFVLFLRFIYHLVYGKLLHKLKQNYEELSRMEE